MPLSNAQMRDVESLLHPYTNLVRFRETGPLVARRARAAPALRTSITQLPARPGAYSICTDTTLEMPGLFIVTP